MRIFITGGTGFIGKALTAALLADGHQLTLLTRQSPENLPPLFHSQAVTFCQNLTACPDFNGFDAVINLAGEPIFDKAWTATQKQKLLDSRLQLTQQLAARIKQSDTPPHTFISGSATGFYGDLQAVEFAKFFDEQTACGSQFPAQLCQQWEAAAAQAQSEKTRVCLLRTGLVLDPSGGALRKMLSLYRLGLAGKLGDGKQHWAWIALADQVRAIQFLLHNSHCQGAYNLVAPQAVSNAEFNRRLAQKLRRPAIFSAPKTALRCVLGERAQLLLDNQPLTPKKLLTDGFQFQFDCLAAYLEKGLV